MLLVLHAAMDLRGIFNGSRFGNLKSLIKLKCLYGDLHITAFLLEEMWLDVGWN